MHRNSENNKSAGRISSIYPDPGFISEKKDNVLGIKF